MHGLGADLLVLAGHKFYAPKGVGVLIRNPEVDLEPLDFGAGHEYGLRPGTENVPLIVGLGAAAVIASKSLSIREQYLRTKATQLQGLLAKDVPGLQLNGHPVHRLPNTLNVSLPGCDAKALLARIGEHVAASAGSACHSDSSAVSGVLGAMGIDAQRAAGAIRLSVGVETTEEDIQQAAHYIANAWAQLRQP
jgi:cysteine desulfurase